MSLADSLTKAQAKSTVSKLVDLLERSGIDLDDISKVRKIKAYQGFYKDNDGEAHTVDMHGIELVPSWVDGPQWPVIQQAPAVKLPVLKNITARPLSGWQTAVILPDIQVGYFRTASNDLEPIHDEAAISVALSITKDVKPDLIVLVGDNADFAELGKYRITPAFQRTTQATIDRLAVLCAQLRAAAPNARIVWLAGNHEERLPNFILDNAAAAYGLRKGGVPESWPVMSMPYLCRFDEFGVEYVPGYPASHFWINNNLKVIHGDKVASGGSTAHKYLATEKVSVVYGHIHRSEQAYRTREDREGEATIMAASPGCLARVDGVVPSTKGGTDLDGRPVQRFEDWQQGIAVVAYEADGGHGFDYHNVRISQGWAFYSGKEYRCTVGEKC